MDQYGSQTWRAPQGLPEPPAPGDGIDDARITAAKLAIEQRLAARLDIDALAAQAGLSRSRFMHLFRQRTGESVVGYAARMRLEYGAKLLRWSDLPVGHISIACGYGSQAAFTRAFIARFGVPPTSFRTTDPRWDVEAEPDAADGVEIREMPEMQCAVARFHGAYFDAPARWAQFLDRLPEPLHPSETGEPLYIAINHDDPGILPAELLRHTLCVVLPEGLTGNAETLRRRGLAEMTQPGGLYASLGYRGPYLEIHNAYRVFFNHWRKPRRYRLAGAPPLELWRRPPLSLAEVECDLLIAVAPVSNPDTSLT